MKRKANALLLESHLKTLRLPTMLAEYAAVVRQCADSDATYEAFLERLAELEVNARSAKATQRRLKQAHFPVTKELSEFDFSAVPKLNKSKILELSRGEFIGQRANLVFLGAPGTGKPRPTQYPVCHGGMRGIRHGHGPDTPSIRQGFQACRHC